MLASTRAAPLRLAGGRSTARRSVVSHAAQSRRSEAELLVHNLPSTANAEVVRRMFRAFDVGRVTVPIDARTGESRGFALVTLKTTKWEPVRDAIMASSAHAAAKAVAAKAHGPVPGGRPSPGTWQVVIELATQEAMLSAVARTCSDLPPQEPMALLGDSRKAAATSVRKPAGHRGASISLSKALVAAEDAEELLNIFRDQEPAFDARHLSTICHRLGVVAPSFRAASAELLQELVERTAASILDEADAWDAQGLASVCWGMAKVDAAETRSLYDAAAREAQKKMVDFNSQALANMAWAFAKAGVEAPMLFDAIGHEVAVKRSSFNPQALANVAWAYSKAGAEAPDLYEDLASESIKKISKFKAQELTNTAWAFATARFEAPALFEAVSASSVAKIETFRPRELSNIVWAYATAGVDSPALFKAVSVESRKQIAHFNSQDLSTVAWAFATAKVEALNLFEAVAVAARKRVSTFTPQALTNTAWAFATAEVDMPQLFEIVAREAPRKMSAFAPKHLATIAWAYSKAQVQAPMLYDAVATEALEKIETFTSKDLANTVWAYTRAGLAKDYAPLYAAVAEEAIRKIDTFNPLDLTNIAWAFQEPDAEEIAAPALIEAIKTVKEYR